MSTLFERVAAYNNLFDAWQKVKTKGSAGGIDNVSITLFDGDASAHIEHLKEQLLCDKYVPEPYKYFKIPKDENEFRELGLPCVKDKIVQSAARQIIEPFFEKQFLNFSYGYRPGKGPVKAIRRVQDRILSEHYEWITIADIDNFFDTVQPEILFGLIEETIKCPKLMKLFRLWVQIGSVNFRFKYQAYREGIPQGSVISPLFSNIYLHPFDQFLLQKGYGPVRYADDFVIFSKTEQQAQQAYRDSRTFLSDVLKLKLNNDWKIKKTAKEFEYMHILFTGGKIGLTPERLQHLCNRIDEVVKPGKSLPDIPKINQTILGISNYYGKLIAQPELEKIDAHLKQRLTVQFGEARRAKTIKNQPEMLNLLQQVNFVSQAFQGKRNEIASEISKSIKPAVQPLNFDSSVPFADKSIQKAIGKKQRYYEDIADSGREILVSKPGVYIGKTKKGITIKESGVLKSTTPLHNLQNITIMSAGVSLSGNVIRYCAENKIPIDFLDFTGLPYARLYAAVYPDAEIGNAQIKALENELAIEIIKLIITGKLKNQLYLLKYYHKYRKDKDADYAEAFAQRTFTIENAIEKISGLEGKNLAETRASLMGHEGIAAAAYWDMIERLLNNYTIFTGRERQGAKDLVNSLLNYGYGILYSRIWQAVIAERLNPHISYLHVMEAGKPTLAFDLIEEFRQQVVDKVVFSLITKGEEMIIEKGQLTHETKTRLIEKILERLNNKEKFRGKELRMSEIIRFQVHAFAQHLQGIKTYKPYVGKW